MWHYRCLRKEKLTSLFLMCRNTFCVCGGPPDTSGKHAASVDVNLSNGRRLWKAAPSKPFNNSFTEIIKKIMRDFYRKILLLANVRAYLPCGSS